MGWHDRHQAPFYRADHAVNVRLVGGGLIAREGSIADLGHFSQGAFGTENRPCFPLSQRFTKMSIKWYSHANESVEELGPPVMAAISVNEAAGAI